MRDSETTYLYFLKSLRYVINLKGRGSQKRLALELGKTEGYVSQIIRSKTKASFDMQVAIADALGYKYEEFLKMGHRIVEGEPLEQPEPPPAPAEPETPPKPRPVTDAPENASHEDIISMFKNKEFARRLNLKLVEIERLDSEQMKSVDCYLDGILAVVRARLDAQPRKKVANDG